MLFDKLFKREALVCKVRTIEGYPVVRDAAYSVNPNCKFEFTKGGVAIISGISKAEKELMYKVIDEMCLEEGVDCYYMN